MIWLGSPKSFCSLLGCFNMEKDRFGSQGLDWAKKTSIVVTLGLITVHEFIRVSWLKHHIWIFQMNPYKDGLEKIPASTKTWKVVSSMLGVLDECPLKKCMASHLFEWCTKKTLGVHLLQSRICECFFLLPTTCAGGVKSLVWALSELNGSLQLPNVSHSEVFLSLDTYVAWLCRV